MLNFTRRVEHFSHVFLDKALSADIWVIGEIEVTKDGISVDVDLIYVRRTKYDQWLNFTSAIMDDENYCEKILEKVTEWYDNGCLGFIDVNNKC